QPRLRRQREGERAAARQDQPRRQTVLHPARRDRHPSRQLGTHVQPLHPPTLPQPSAHKHDNREHVTPHHHQDIDEQHLRVGTRFVTVRSSASWSSPRSGCCTSMPPRMRLSCSSLSGSKPPGGSSSKRRFFFAAKISFARAAKPGAAMHSTNSFATSSAVAASTWRLNASTPPNAETGSHASAFKYASRSVACSAVPQGLLCFMITAAGFS